jgi:hypothetical protein
MISLSACLASVNFKAPLAIVSVLPLYSFEEFGD